MNLSPSLRLDRRGLTLIEMLIGMAITLVMMAAVVQLFANISQGVRNRRATMEVSAKLRIARAQLYNDLAGATCLKYPKDTHAVMPKPDSNNMPDGYFEIVEGRRADEDPGGNFDQATSLIPSTGLLYDADGQPLNPNIVTDGGGLGDYDDVVAMTVESQTERFKGRGRGLRPGGDPTDPTHWMDMAISSPVAEVVWFALQNPPDRSEGEPGMRKVYRRVVLITPWYGTVTNNFGTGSDPLLDLTNSTIYPDYASRLAALRDFQARYDISVRLENQRLVPNTLADLARREFRYEHMPNHGSIPPLIYPNVFVSTGSGYTGPTVRVTRHPFDTETANAQITALANPVNLPNDIGDIREFNVVNGGRYSRVPSLLVEGTMGISATARPIMRSVGNGAWEIARVVYGPAPLPFDREGEDLVLDEVLAFDTQVYDPGAPLYNYQGSIVPPSSSRAFQAATGTPITNITGFGAYVDLGWNNAQHYNYFVVQAANPNAPSTLFQQERRLGWHPRDPNNPIYRRAPSTYDTWTTYYETDTIDQDNIDGDNDVSTGADQGTNGLDDPVPFDADNDFTTAPVIAALNGPDDPLERETSPPYPYPLYGVQVKLRLYEPESRQIRETTVTRNLAK